MNCARKIRSTVQCHGSGPGGFNSRGTCFCCWNLCVFLGGCGRCRWVRRRCGEAKCSVWVQCRASGGGRNHGAKTFQESQEAWIRHPCRRCGRTPGYKYGNLVTLKTGRAPVPVSQPLKTPSQSARAGPGPLASLHIYKYVRTCLRWEMSGCPGHAVRARYLKTS